MGINDRPGFTDGTFELEAVVINTINTILTCCNTINNTTAAHTTTLSTMDGKIDDIDTEVDHIEIDAHTIDTVVDGIASTLTVITNAITVVDTVVDGIEVHAHQAEAKIDIVDGILDDLHGTDIPAIKTDTGNLLSNLTTADGKIVAATAQITAVNAHLHNKVLLSPNLALGILITASATPWTLGVASASILTVGANEVIDIHIIEIESISPNYGTYQLDIIHSIEGTIISFPFARRVIADPDSIRMCINGSHLCGTGTFTAKLAYSGGAAATCRIKLGYHVEVP